MPIDVQVLQGGVGRRWVVTGAVSGKELIANNERIFSTKSYEGVRWLIVDYTATREMDVSPEEVRTIKEQDDRLAAVLPEIVTAVVVQYDLGFGMTRMWEMLTERPGWSVRAFRSMPEAESWVREEVMRKFGMELPKELK
jgi:hypothetical protein